MRTSDSTVSAFYPVRDRTFAGLGSPVAAVRADLRVEGCGVASCGSTGFAKVGASFSAGPPSGLPSGYPPLGQDRQKLSFGTKPISTTDRLSVWNHDPRPETRDPRPLPAVGNVPDADFQTLEDRGGIGCETGGFWSRWNRPSGRSPGPWGNRPGLRAAFPGPGAIVRRRGATARNLRAAVRNAGATAPNTEPPGPSLGQLPRT